MGDVDTKFDKFVENYSLDMKILLNKIDSIFCAQTPVKSQNQLEHDNNNNNNNQASPLQLNNYRYDENIISNNTNIMHTELEKLSEEGIEKNLLIERMLNDNFCLLNTNSTSLINNSSNNKNNLINLNLKSILIKSSAINNSDNINTCSNNLLENFPIESKLMESQSVKLKRHGIKKQLTFGEDMSTGNLKRKNAEDTDDNLSLNLKTVQVELSNKSDSVLIRNIESKTKKSNNADIEIPKEANASGNSMLQDYEKKLLAESENSSVQINDIDDDDIEDYNNDNIFSTVFLKEENEQQDDKDLLKSKYKNKNNFNNKNADL